MSTEWWNRHNRCRIIHHILCNCLTIIRCIHVWRLLLRFVQKRISRTLALLRIFRGTWRDTPNKPWPTSCSWWRLSKKTTSYPTNQIPMISKGLSSLANINSTRGMLTQNGRKRLWQTLKTGVREAKTPVLWLTPRSMPSASSTTLSPKSPVQILQKKINVFARM